MKKQNYVSLIALLMSIILIAVMGYYIFLQYMTTFVPNIETYSLITIAIVAGIAAFFNPCNFSLLPVFITQFTTAIPKNKQFRSTLLYGLAAASGVAIFNLLLGSFIGLLGAGLGKSLALGGSQPNLFVRIFRGVVALLLITLGVSHFKGMNMHFKFIDNTVTRFSYYSKKNPIRSLFTYGFFYVALGVGCGGPILAGLSIYALSQGGVIPALFAFMIFTTTMAFLMLAVTVAIGLAQNKILTTLSRSTVIIKKISGIILLIVGLLLLLSAIYTAQFTALLFP